MSEESPAALLRRAAAKVWAGGAEATDELIDITAPLAGWLESEAIRKDDGDRTGKPVRAHPLALDLARAVLGMDPS